MRVNNYQRILAAVFVVMLFGFSAYNIYAVHDIIHDEITEIFEKKKEPEEYVEYTAAVDKMLSTNLYGGHIWNEIYGTVYKMLGKNEENNFSYVRDKSGMLHFSNFWNETDVPVLSLARRMRRLQDDVRKNGTKVVLLLYPSKYDIAWSKGYYGMPYQDYNEYADEFLRYLRRYNVDYIDYRPAFRDSGKDEGELFFYNDHHWTVDTGFNAMTMLVDHIRDTYNEDWDPEHYYCDKDNYFTETYDHIFMGSQGREAGEIYSELDDYSFLLPDFETKVSWKFTSTSGSSSEVRGNLRDVLISHKNLDKNDVYERDMNNSYMSGIFMRDIVENMSSGEDKARILLLRNSYSSTLATFLTPMVREMSMIWSRYYPEEEALKVIKAQPYDYIFVCVTTDNLEDAEFPFYKKEPDQERSEEGEDGQH